MSRLARVLILLGLSVSCGARAVDAATPHGAEIAGAIDRLKGSSDSNDPIAAIKALDDYGCEAVPYLVDRLRVVRAAKGQPYAGGNDDTDGRVVWSATALRYIAGREFRSRISARELKVYDDEGRYWMTKDIAAGQTRLYGWWPSHGAVYFVPERAQAHIIGQWRAFAAGGDCRRDEVKATDFMAYGFGDMHAAE